MGQTLEVLHDPEVGFWEVKSLGLMQAVIGLLHRQVLRTAARCRLIVEGAYCLCSKLIR